ncbi:hypothetical protein ACSHXN_14475 [Streptomyces sp. HUAS TT11]|uniref:hypothetical protein n=1 Tax=Streptomyces sp. HUAS TT11 TaxID=3447508 RepID=UPI003F659CBA
MPATIDSHSDWHRLRPATTHAVHVLLEQLENSEATEQGILDAYLYAKRLLAESTQALLRAGLPERYEPFHEMRSNLEEELRRRYGDRIDSRYLTVPYGSRVHEQLFTVLVQHLGEPVTADYLRVVTADSVHAERRTRELRELGLRVESKKVNSGDVYILASLELDFNLIPAVIKNNIRAKGPGPGTAELLAELGY